MPRTLTQEEFIQKAVAVWGDRYDLNKVVYVSAKTKIEVVCKEHEVFLITPNNLLSRKGCPKCAAESRGIKERELTAQGFIARCVAVHGDKYVLDKTEYKASAEYITATCREHGDFSMLPSNFLRGKGCRLCANKKRGDESKLTHNEFVSRVSAANEFLVPTEKTRYNGLPSKVHYSCGYEGHGEFKSKAATLLKGRGCPKCAKHGFRTDSDAYIYILAAENGLTKVGITNREPIDRAKNVSKSSGIKFQPIRDILYADGSIPLEVETNLLREMRANFRQPVEVFDGSTECFYGVDHEWLLLRIIELTKECMNGSRP